MRVADANLLLGLICGTVLGSCGLFLWWEAVEPFLRMRRRRRTRRR